MLKSRNLLIIIGILVFILGLTASYLLLGNRFPWAGRIWHQLVKVFPIPVATVEGYDVKNDLVEAAKRLDVPDPMNFAIQATAIRVLADRERVTLLSWEIEAKERQLEANWNGEKLQDSLNSRKVSKADFRKLFIEPDLYKEKLAVLRQVKTAKVDEVSAKLNSGRDFASVAASLSEDPLTRSFGGDAGFLSENEVFSGLWTEAKKLGNGLWAGPIATPDGYMFIKRLGENGPSQIHLQVILIKTFDFDLWLSEQIKKMRVIVYI